MTEHKYTIAAVSAALLAILFPMYWANQFWSVAVHGGDALYKDVTGLNPSDFLFSLIGILTVHVYLSLKKYLNERHAFHATDILLILLAITAAVFTFGSIAMDILMQFFGQNLHLPWHKGVVEGNTVALVISTMMFGILDLLLGIMLLSKARGVSDLLTVFAVTMLILGVFGLSIVFSPVTIVIFPVALIVLAVLFARQPEMLEVI